MGAELWYKLLRQATRVNSGWLHQPLFTRKQSTVGLCQLLRSKIRLHYGQVFVSMYGVSNGECVQKLRSQSLWWRMPLGKLHAYQNVDTKHGLTRWLCQRTKLVNIGVHCRPSGRMCFRGALACVRSPMN